MWKTPILNQLQINPENLILISIISSASLNWHLKKSLILIPCPEVHQFLLFIHNKILHFDRLIKRQGIVLNHSNCHCHSSCNFNVNKITKKLISRYCNLKYKIDFFFQLLKQI